MDAGYEGAAGTAQELDFISTAGGDVYSGAGKTGRRTWGAFPPPHVAANAMAEVLGRSYSDAAGAYSAAEGGGGVLRVRPEPPTVKPHGRAAGAYNPGVTDGPAAGLAPHASACGFTPSNSNAAAAMSARGEASGAAAGGGGGGGGVSGVPSRRLNEIQIGTQLRTSALANTHDSPYVRQQFGVREGRAGVGGPVPDEIRICGLHRRRTDTKRVPSERPRNVILGDSSVASPEAEKSKPRKGRVHLGEVPTLGSKHGCAPLPLPC